MPLGADTQVHRSVRTDPTTNLSIPLRCKKQPKTDIQSHLGAAIDSAIELCNPPGCSYSSDALEITKEKIAKVKRSNSGRVVGVWVMVGPGNARSIPQEIMPMRRLTETPFTCPGELEND